MLSVNELVAMISIGCVLVHLDAAKFEPEIANLGPLGLVTCDADPFKPSPFFPSARINRLVKKYYGAETSGVPMECPTKVTSKSIPTAEDESSKGLLGSDGQFNLEGFVNVPETVDGLLNLLQGIGNSV